MTQMDILRGLEGLEPGIVLDAAPKTVNRKPAHRGWIAVAASLAVILTVVSVAGFGNVSAVVRQLFSFIPGVGIQQENIGAVYTCEPIFDESRSGEMIAQLLRASYSQGMLSATVHISGKAVHGDDVMLYINGQFQKDAECFFAISQEDTMADILLEGKLPADTDQYEIRIHGFANPLTFTLKPCESFENLQQIGPTVTHNGISLTVTAHRSGSELVVWCYETRQEGATTDEVVGYGSPTNSSNSSLRHLETESGEIYENIPGWHIGSRMEYTLAEADRTAMLHIPYLAMQRQAEGMLSLNLPKEYTTVSCDQSIQTDLGSIRAVSLERSVYARNPTKDRILIELDYENKSDMQQMYAMIYQIAGDHTNAVHTDSASGTVKYIEVLVSPDTEELEIHMDGVYYYWMEEYLFELEIP